MEQVLQYVCPCPHYCSVQNYFHLKQTQDPKCPQQVPAGSRAGGWWCHHNPNANEQGESAWDEIKKMHISHPARGICCVCLECAAAGSPHRPVVGCPPRAAAAASCRTTACLWGAVGSTAFLLTENEWWCFHFDGVSLGNSPHTLA